jgi:hypothetical protein
MGLTYFKRFRMELDLKSGRFEARTCDDYRFVAWRPELVETHAEIMYQSFRFEMDASVFPCFTERNGCLRLMDDISQKDGFLPGATWLILYVGAGPRKREFCGTIQGLGDTSGVGAVQNLGITPLHRGRGLGKRLMQQALAGFKEAGMRRVYLEVTAQNRAAVELYQRLGFRRARTLYKAVEVAYS